MITTETNNIFCNKIAPPEFTAEQIEKCRGNKEKGIPPCRHASGKGLWCCHFGIKISEKKIIQPSRKIVQPFPKNNAEYNKDRYNREYAIAIDMAKNSGKKLVNEKVYINRRKGCAGCPPEEKQGCPCMGCKQWQQLVYETEDDRGQPVECRKGVW